MSIQKSIIEIGASLLDVSESSLTVFSQIDIFNNKLLEGVICKGHGDLYGSMILFRIDGEETCQIIYGTPKLHYPFDKKGDFHWPKLKNLQFWEKLDGTNVLSFSYTHKGRSYYSFKTRLTPVIKDSQYGNFYELLKEYLKNNKWVNDVIDHNPECNLSFEMYGYRNPILIKYEKDLDLSLLFGVSKDSGRIVPLTELKRNAECKIPIGVLCNDKCDVHHQYMSMRTNMSTINKNSFKIEGMVLYAQLTDGTWILYKTKPEEVEKIHWAASGFIPENSLFTTAINLFEDNENPTIQDLENLLKEEYDDFLILKNQERIKKAFQRALFRMSLIKDVNNVIELAKKEGIDTKNRIELFRFMSKHFDRNIMQKVGTIVLSQEKSQKE